MYLGMRLYRERGYDLSDGVVIAYWVSIGALFGGFGYMNYKFGAEMHAPHGVPEDAEKTGTSKQVYPEVEVQHTAEIVPSPSRKRLDPIV